MISHQLFRFWFVFVAVSTLINCIYTFSHMALASLREKNAKFCLMSIDENRENPILRNCIKRFVNNGLRPGEIIIFLSISDLDGVLLMKFIESHSGTMVAKDLTVRMFNDYMEMAKGSSTTKSTTPGYGDGPREYLYPPEKPFPIDLSKNLETAGLMDTDGHQKV